MRPSAKNAQAVRRHAFIYGCVAAVFTSGACVILLVHVFAGASLFAQQDLLYKDDGRRDPFISLVTSDGRLLKIDKPTGRHAEMVVQGVVYDPGKDSYVIANGDVIGLGGTIGDYTVVKIEENQVTLSKVGDGELMVLKVNKEGDT